MAKTALGNGAAAQDGGRQSVRWWESLHFKFSSIHLMLLLFIVGGSITVLFTVQRNLILNKGYKIADEVGHGLVYKFRERMKFAESLSASMAHLGGVLRKDASLFRRVIPGILNYSGEEAFIAGGGIWPQPYQFTPGVIRRSFFWGRDRSGKLRYYDDYNNPGGKGYHNEEWYVPAVVSPSGKRYWSKSYMDPYSYQPMVTCTTPIVVRGKITGVSTIDVRLESLDAFFRKTARILTGYIFAVDSNNRFLSFPDHTMAKRYSTDKKGRRVEEFLLFGELAARRAAYLGIARYLNSVNSNLVHLARSNPDFTSTLVNKIHTGSYQISKKEAALIAALMVTNTARVNGQEIPSRRLFIRDDPILKEPVTVSIFVIPETNWKIIIVNPQSKFFAVADAATIEVILYLAGFELIALVIMFLVFKRLFIGPVHEMVVAVRNAGTMGASQDAILDAEPRNELGTLAHEFNRRTRRLMDEIERSDTANRKLRNLRNYLANMIDSMPSIVVGVDATGRVTQWNAMAEQYSGIATADARGQLITELVPDLLPEMDTILESLKTCTILNERRTISRTEEEFRHMDVTVYPLVANGAEGAVIRVDDVTEKVRMGEVMIQTEKMLSIGGLAAGMAHEINNPLTGIIQTIQIIENRLIGKAEFPVNRKAADEAGIRPEALRKFMETRDIPRMISIITECGERITKIVRNTLDFARSSTTLRSSCNLEKLIDSALVLAGTDFNLKKKYGFREMMVTKEYEADLPLVPCDPSSIQQVLLNLFRNGAQAMQEAETDEPGFIIRTRFEEERQMVCIEVEDSGPGMDAETQKRIFDPFFTTKPVGEGTGLGLSVSYFIITENHGGELAVRSEPGEGATFIIRLPLNREG